MEASLTIEAKKHLPQFADSELSSTGQSMMMRPQDITGIDIGFNGIFIAGCMFHDFAAATNALIRLDVRAGRDFLQENLDRFAAIFTFKGKDAGGFIHGKADSG